jgi:hypothetical protein
MIVWSLWSRVAVLVQLGGHNLAPTRRMVTPLSFSLLFLYVSMLLPLIYCLPPSISCGPKCSDYVPLAPMWAIYQASSSWMDVLPLSLS